MRVDKLRIKNFKNLQDFSIDFDESQLTTVLIGRNGTGKSNLIEALVAIFGDLDPADRPSFEYDLKYECRGHNIEVFALPSEKTKTFRILVDGIELSKGRFNDRRNELLPNHVFGYYSGPSRRLESYFDSHQKDFYEALLSGEEKPLRRFFYARPIHSQFVLLSYFSFPDKVADSFLKNQFGIKGLESVLVVLKEPDWAGRLSEHAKTLGDQRFWFARGVVKDFLSGLYDAALAPIRVTESVASDYRSKPTQEEHLYLFVADEKSLAKLASTYASNQDFFKQLESMYISDLLRETRIKVKKTDTGVDITFKELSEGEQQLLTVLGLMKFTREQESLFLLDEPNTHLNPVWAYSYMDLLEQVAYPGENSQLIIATHEPLMICGLTRNQVQILEFLDGKIIARPPAEDPKGMGVAGVLTSELFGLQSTLDRETLAKLQRRQELFGKEKRNEKEGEEMRRLSDELAQFGFGKTVRDPLYEKFLKALSRNPIFKKPLLTPEEIKKQDNIADSVIDEILAEERRK
jgi:predicted ATPase